MWYPIEKKVFRNENNVIFTYKTKLLYPLMHNLKKIKLFQMHLITQTDVDLFNHPKIF